MTGFGAIFTILAALIPFGIWLYKARAKRKADPAVQNQERKEQIAKEIITRDAEAVNRSLDDDLERVRSLERSKLQGNRSGSDGSATEKQ